jgi:hypothetical protein
MDGRVLRQVGGFVAGSGLFVKYFFGAILGALGGVCWVSLDGAGEVYFTVQEVMVSSICLAAM